MSLHVDYLRHRLLSSNKWRRTISKKYAFDFRNSIACDLLPKLAALPDDSVTPETLAKLSTFSGPLFVDAVQAACREIGFKYQPQTLDEVARRVIGKLVPDSSAEEAFAALTGGAR